ncbi:MAG: hypothetical protein NUV91_01480, partial [Candidatus Omnitrophica bacterium]|nr:hypothetical protein [Candidatus Omnitrophota bacterium]
MIRSVIILLISGNLILPSGLTAVHAQGMPTMEASLPSPGTMIQPGPAFYPAVLRGVKLDPMDPLRFDFIVDTGDVNLQGQPLQNESTKLIKYFLATLTLPESDLWVNLSPNEPDRIAPNNLASTEMGRDMLAQDYLLKQLTSSLMYPEGEVGKKFWGTVYQRAQEKFGTTQIPVDTFNKVWIVPDKAVVYEKGDRAFVTQARLKVMLEEDYLGQTTKKSKEISKDVIREIIIPELEREVNEGQNFVLLRQIYHSMILATWFKKNLRESVLGRIYVEKSKVAGVEVDDPAAKEKIYEQYLAAFKKGAYNYIKEEIDPTTKQLIPRKYFSGGENMAVGDALTVTGTAAQTRVAQRGQAVTTEIYLEPMRRLDRLLDILHGIREYQPFQNLPNDVSEEQILMAVVEYLQSLNRVDPAHVFITQEEVDDNGRPIIIYTISDVIKNSRVGQAIVDEVMAGPSGVQAINFPWQ